MEAPMPASDGKGRDGAAGRKPVRLSDLAPPQGRTSGIGKPGALAGLPAARRPAAPSVPSRPPGPLPQNSPIARPAPQTVDAAARLRDDLQKSEDARGRAEARVAELERQVAGLSAGGTGESVGSGDSRAEVERLRRELEDAHAIIRTIEQAYLAGGGEPAPEP